MKCHYALSGVWVGCIIGGCTVLGKGQSSCYLLENILLTHDNLDRLKYGLDFWTFSLLGLKRGFILRHLDV